MQSQVLEEIGSLNSVRGEHTDKLPLGRNFGVSCAPGSQGELLCLVRGCVWAEGMGALRKNWGGQRGLFTYADVLKSGVFIAWSLQQYKHVLRARYGLDALLSLETQR